MSGTTREPATPTRRMRTSRKARTALACTSCRQRKARCSGDWPICTACIRRHITCFYPGRPPSALPAIDVTSIPAVGPLGSSSDGTPSLPSDPLRKLALAYFREHYAPTLLCFLPPQQLVEDDCGRTLAPALLLSIFALVARGVPALAENEGSASTVGDRYAEMACRALAVSYEEPLLVTVQCCLVLCVYEMGEGAEYRGWLRVGHAARLAQLAQLHRQDAPPTPHNWGNTAPAPTPTVAECRRRTFWCCFCLERLLANGRDRIAVFLPEDITTKLPQTDEDFIYGRPNVKYCTLGCSSTCLKHGACNSLLALTIRIVHILSAIMTWHGRGGRHLDSRCPWLADMPFTVLDEMLQRWRNDLPNHLDYRPGNISAAIAAGHGRLWFFMFMIYFQACTYLHREYLPFTPKMGYDPVLGPCDGPALVPTDTAPPAGFWLKSTIVMVESANAISELYGMMVRQNLSPSAYPFPGMCLLTASSVHVIYTLFSWESMHDVITAAKSREYLRQDMESLNHLGQRWSLAVHWIRQVSLYYRLNSMTKKSWTNSKASSPAMDIEAIKDGIMNYVRQISQRDRETREINLRPTFDFDGWLAVLRGEDNKAMELALRENDTRIDPVIEHSGEAGGDDEWTFDGWDSWDTAGQLSLIY